MHGTWFRARDRRPSEARGGPGHCRVCQRMHRQLGNTIAFTSAPYGLARPAHSVDDSNCRRQPCADNRAHYAGHANRLALAISI